MVYQGALLIAAWTVISAGVGAADHPASTPPRPAAGQVQIVAEEMCCKGCAQRISGQLYTVKGVKSVEVDLASRVLTVSVPQDGPSTLGALWNAVQKGKGGPAKLATHSATYQLFKPEDAESHANNLPNGSLRIVIDNLHCAGCAQKIASRLYTIKGVTKVQADLEANTLLVEAKRGALATPWPAIAAVVGAKERALSLTGEFGTLAIEHAAPAAAKTHQAQQTITGGVRR